MIDIFKTNQKDITISWDSQRKLPQGIMGEGIAKNFPSFNVKILDENLNDLYIYENIPSAEQIGVISKASYSAKEKFIRENPAVVFTSPRVQASIFDVQDFIKNSFTFSIEENGRIFFEKNNKYGLYKKVHILISHNDYARNSYECLVEYEDPVLLDFQQATEKIYRSTDGLSIKFKFDPLKFESSKVAAILILAKSDNIILSPLFSKDLPSKWLNSIENSKILTLPFKETGLLEDIDLLDIELYGLSLSQSVVVEEILKENNLTILKEFLDSFISCKIIDSIKKVNPSAIEIQELKERLARLEQENI